MPHHLHVWVAVCIYVGLCIGTFWLGDRSQKTAAVLLFVQVVLDNITHDVAHLQDPQYWTAALDGMLLIGLVVLAFSSKKSTLLAAAGFQLVATTVHFIKMMDPAVHGWAYLSATIAFGWLVLCTVVLGAALTWLRRRKAREEARIVWL